jgi:hypothetical protein
MTNAERAGAPPAAAGYATMDATGTNGAAERGPDARQTRPRLAVTTLALLLLGAACGGGDGPATDGAWSSPELGTACDTFTSFRNIASDACIACYYGDACSSPRTEAFREQLDGRTCPSVATECQACPAIVTGPGYCSCQSACLGACQPALDAWFQCLVSRCSAACT